MIHDNCAIHSNCGSHNNCGSQIICGSHNIWEVYIQRTTIHANIYFGGVHHLVTSIHGISNYEGSATAMAVIRPTKLCDVKVFGRYEHDASTKKFLIHSLVMACSDNDKEFTSYFSQKIKF